MTDLKELLTNVYGETAAQKLIEDIQLLKQKYEIPKPQRSLNERDVCLIAYGDQVYEEGRPTLETLKSFLDNYLTSISTVHILPFYPYSSDDGFSVIDYYAVNENLGDWPHVEELSKEYRLMFDAVINHISQHSEWFQGFLKGQPEYLNYFIEEDPSIDLSEVVRPRTSPLLHDFESGGGVKHVWTTFSRDQVDINYRNPKVFLHIIDVLLFYLSKGASMLRLDAIAFMWKEVGTSCIHLPQTHELIQAMRQILESVNPNVVIITETNVPHLENISYFGNGHNEAHMVYNFTLPPLLAFSILKGNTAKLKNWAQSLEWPGEEACYFNFTASHDGIGLRPVDGILTAEEIDYMVEAAKANGGLVNYRKLSDGGEAPYELNCNYFSLMHGTGSEKEVAQKRFLLAQAVLLSMPGLPALYFHSVVGSENYSEGVKITGQNRTINREKLALDELIKEISDPQQARHTIYSTLTELMNIRSREEAFNPYGKFSFPACDDQLFMIEKEFNNSRLLAVYNISEINELIVNLGNETAYDLISSQKVNLNQVKLAPLSFMWLKIK